MTISPTLFSEGIKYLAQFGRIKSLNLADNKLTMIPSELGMLRSLKTLGMLSINL